MPSSAALTPKIHRFSVGGEASIAWARSGSPSAPCLLFFHGTPGSLLQAFPLLHEMSHTGFQVLTFDRPGFGQTSPMSADHLNHGLTQLLDSLQIPQVITVAVSGGSPSALRFLRHSPHRVLDSAFVAASAPFWEQSTSTQLSLTDRFLKRAARSEGPNWSSKLLSLLRIGLLGVKSSGILRLALHQDLSAADRLVLKNRRWSDLFLADLQRALSQGVTPLLEDLHENYGQWSIALPENTPAPFITIGEGDRLIPPHFARQLHQHWPGSELLTLPGSGHMDILVHCSSWLERLSQRQRRSME